MPSEGWHSWHPGAHISLLSSPSSATISDDDGQGVTAGGRNPRDLQESAVGQMEQLADMDQSDLSAKSRMTRQSDARD